MVANQRVRSLSGFVLPIPELVSEMLYYCTIYNNVTGAVFFDPDGSANGSAQTQFATLLGAPDITRFDFLVI